MQTELASGVAPARGYNLGMQLQQIADILGATLRDGAAAPADGALDITGVAPLETAGPTELSFLDNPKYTSLARTTKAAAVLVEPRSDPLPRPGLLISNPYLAFARALELFYHPPRYAPGVHPTAVIHPSATLADDIHIGPYACIGEGVSIGAGSVLLAHVVLYAGVVTGARLFAHAHAVVREHCVLGDDVILGNGVVIGGDGFGFARDAARGWYKIVQSGPVVLGDGVEVQANSCVDRASVGQTTVADGVKIDNLVQVGHGSSIGAHTLLCAQVGLAGSSHVGQRVILAGQVGVAGHLTIGDDAVATAQTGVPTDVPAGLIVSGYPAIESSQWRRASAALTRLPELLRRVGRLERQSRGKST